MRTRKITFWTILVVIVLAVVGFYFYRSNADRNKTISSDSVTSSQSDNSKNKKSNNKNKILIVYFSRKDGVYNSSRLKRGNTQVIAEDIRDHTDGDIYQIKTIKSYPKNYDKTTQVAQDEQDRNARPALKGKLPDVSKYNVVFIGAPVWWGEYPMAVRTFMDKEPGLNGKTLIPFSTHAGSGLANFPETLKKQFPRSKVREGLAVEGTEVNDARGRVDSWLNRLGY